MLDILEPIIYNADAKGINSHGGGLSTTDNTRISDNHWFALVNRAGIEIRPAQDNNRV